MDGVYPEWLRHLYPERSEGSPERQPGVRTKRSARAAFLWLGRRGRSRDPSLRSGYTTCNRTRSVNVDRFTGLIGIALILAIAYALSDDRRAIRWRIVVWGIAMQVLIAIAVLKGELIAAMMEPVVFSRLSTMGATVIFIIVSV